ncbi:MAG: HPt (histidine-containing phosphotransfer) domain-containing protein [Planctomycetota bacterium]|jgi:HPt (histidine-containing phosphotransfer) domain-containing protein
MKEYNQTVLDFDVIEGLRELGGEDDPGLVLELIEMFLDDAPNHLDDMMMSMKSSNAELMQRSVHTLKSSSANMGAIRLPQICNEMEQLAQNADINGYRKLTSTCLDAFKEVDAALRQIS